jgi:hypothetical protein
MIGDEPMNRFLPLPVILLVLHAGLLAHALEPANPRANVQARAGSSVTIRPSW